MSEPRVTPPLSEDEIKRFTENHYLGEMDKRLIATIREREAQLAQRDERIKRLEDMLTLEEMKNGGLEGRIRELEQERDLYQTLFYECQESLCSCNIVDNTTKPIGDPYNYVCEWHEMHQNHVVAREPLLTLSKAKDDACEQLRTLQTLAGAALKSWDTWQASVETVIERPINYAGWPELEALRAALPVGEKGE